MNRDNDIFHFAEGKMKRKKSALSAKFAGEFLNARFDKSILASIHFRLYYLD